MADKPITDPRILCAAAIAALAAHVARQIISNAAECDEDPREVSTDAEIVEMYAHDIAGEVAKLIPALIQLQLPHATDDE